MTGPEHARAALRIHHGHRTDQPAETAPVACSWCGAAPDRPCRTPAGLRPLQAIHDARRTAAATRDEEFPCEP